jgi:hypothetical protein|tara:strand:+ start:168 stop:344 length:177 start_codon:yes stop_codon:yes gene_type:complete
MKDTIMQVTQPVSLGVGSAVFMGIQLDEWVLIGTLFLIILNSVWGLTRVYDRFFNKVN